MAGFRYNTRAMRTLVVSTSLFVAVALFACSDDSDISSSSSSTSSSQSSTSTGGGAGGSGASGGGMGGEANTGGTPNTGGAGMGGNGGIGGSALPPECQSPSDCFIVNDCCNCLSLPVGTMVPDCAILNCLVPTCQAEGNPNPVAECINGQCAVGPTQ